jgi:excisionase family DNA binding protein
MSDHDAPSWAARVGARPPAPPSPSPSPSPPAPPLPLPLPRLLSLIEVADLTGLSPSTLRRQIRLRKLAVIRIGAALRIAEDDLADFLRRRRRAAR